MAFNLTKLSLPWRIGALLSLLAATMVAENLYAFDAEAADEAATMLRTGVQTTATPLRASDTITIAVSFGFTRAFRVHYSFADGQGRQWTGGGHLTETEYNDLADPSQPETVRADARVAIVYDPADPVRNGILSAYQSEPGPRLWLVVAAFAVVLSTGLVLTWRADRAWTRRDVSRRRD